MCGSHLINLCVLRFRSQTSDAGLPTCQGTHAGTHAKIVARFLCFSSWWERRAGSLFNGCFSTVCPLGARHWNCGQIFTLIPLKLQSPLRLLEPNFFPLFAELWNATKFSYTPIPRAPNCTTARFKYFLLCCCFWQKEATALNLFGDWKKRSACYVVDILRSGSLVN